MAQNTEDLALLLMRAFEVATSHASAAAQKKRKNQSRAAAALTPLGDAGRAEKGHNVWEETETGSRESAEIMNVGAKISQHAAESVGKPQVSTTDAEAGTQSPATTAPTTLGLTVQIE